jgi:hypothetical protein
MKKATPTGLGHRVVPIMATNRQPLAGLEYREISHMLQTGNPYGIAMIFMNPGGVHYL